MEKFLRWLCIKLLSRPCLKKSPEWTEDRKVYTILHRGALYINLVGHKPGTSYGAPGRKVFVLMGECIHYLVDRTVLRRCGSLFDGTGIICVKRGPGVSWCWYLQIGR